MYQCIPLPSKDYKAVLERVKAHPSKSKKYMDLSVKYDFAKKSIKLMESLSPNEQLALVIDDLRKTLTQCQEGMAKLLDAEYRVMQREAKQMR